MKKIFIAFSGPKINQEEKIIEFSDNYQCWNLNLFKYDEYIATTMAVVEPLNDNIVRQYENPDNTPFNFTQVRFDNASWGLMIPDTIVNMSSDGFGEIYSLIELYSLNFLYPVFYVSGMGISVIAKNYEKTELPSVYYHSQNRINNFKSENFCAFFDKLSTESTYGVWEAPRTAKWNKEDWRLFIAFEMFTGLRKYEFRKKSFLWQEEAAALSTILETLLSDECDKSEIGYRLRKRSAVLLGSVISDIEKQIKDLYSERSNFVHGSFFAKIYKEAKKSPEELPMPDFAILEKHTKNIRYMLVAYLYLNKIIKEGKLPPFTRVLDAIEAGIIDTSLRCKIQEYTNEIIGLLPTD